MDRRALALTTIAIGTVACSDYKPGDDTWASVNPLQTTADWSCLQPTLEEPPTPGETGSPLLYPLQIVDLANEERLAEVSVVACGLRDYGCNAPITARHTTNENGLVAVPLSENFNGYLKIESLEVVPYIFHFPDRGVRAMPDYPLYMIKRANYQEFLGAFDLPVDPSLGAIAVRVFDCGHRPAAGVQLTLRGDNPGTRWYFEAGLPNTDRDETDESGLAGYVGVGTSMGIRVLEAKLPGGTPVINQSVIVQTNFMTAGYLAPNRSMD